MTDFKNANPKVPQKPSPEIENKQNTVKSAEICPEYPHVFPINLPGGSFYIDSTPDKENIFIRHKSGSYIFFETNGDVRIRSKKDIIVDAERNVALKVGEGNKDKCMIHVTGDAHFKVENDYIVEVGGDKNETISGNYNLNVKGTMSTAANTRNDKISGKYTVNTHEQENNVTFIKNNVGIPDETGIGGEIRDVIFGNRVIEMALPNGCFTIRSLGTLELSALLNMRCEVGGAYIGNIAGAYTETVGGAYSITGAGTVSISSGGLMNIKSGGFLNIVGSQIFLN